jgi:hypothetical protein
MQTYRSEKYLFSFVKDCTFDHPNTGEQGQGSEYTKAHIQLSGTETACHDKAWEPNHVTVQSKQSFVSAVIS